MRKKIAVNFDKCTGCRICELVCSMVKEGAFNYRKARIRLVKLDERGIDAPIVCKICEKPPCIEICPTRAIMKNPMTGALTVYEKLCFGCGLCLEACPIGAVFIHPERGIAVICDLCKGDPVCVKYCPTQALTYQPTDVVVHRKRVHSVLVSE